MDLTGNVLTHLLSKALFKAIKETPELRLKRLTVVAGMDPVSVWPAGYCPPEQYLSEALVLLKKVNLSGICFPPYFADAISKKILATENLKLRSLKLSKAEDFPASPALLNNSN